MSDMHNESRDLRETAKADADHLAEAIKQTQTAQMLSGKVDWRDPKIVGGVSFFAGFMLGRRSA